MQSLEVDAEAVRSLHPAAQRSTVESPWHGDLVFAATQDTTAGFCHSLGSGDVEDGLDADYAARKTPSRSRLLRIAFVYSAALPLTWCLFASFDDESKQRLAEFAYNNYTWITFLVCTFHGGLQKKALRVEERAAKAGLAGRLLATLADAIPIYIMTGSLVPALWVYSSAHQSEMVQTTFKANFQRMILTSIFGPIAIACYWTLRERGVEKACDRCEDDGDFQVQISSTGMVQLQATGDSLSRDISSVNFVAFQSGPGVPLEASILRCGEGVMALHNSAETLYLFVYTDDQQLGRLHVWHLTSFTRPCRAYLVQTWTAFADGTTFHYDILLIMLILLVSTLAFKVGLLLGPSGGPVPCFAPVPNATQCGVPCINSMTSEGFGFANGTFTKALDSGLCRTYFLAVDVGLTTSFGYVSFMLWIGLYCGVVFLRFSWSLDGLLEAINIASWTSLRPHASRQVDFLMHMVNVRSTIGKDSGLIEEYGLEFLPVVPKCSSDPAVLSLWSQRRQASSITPTTEKGTLCWGWWFRYRAALLAELQWAYFAMQFVITGLSLGWIQFVTSLLLSATTAKLPEIMKDAGAQLVFASVLYGLPLLLVVVLGAHVNSKLQESLPAIQDSLQRVEDLQRFGWAAQHNFQLRIFGLPMDLNMIATTVGTLFTSLAVFGQSNGS